MIWTLASSQKSVSGLHSHKGQDSIDIPTTLQEGRFTYTLVSKSIIMAKIPSMAKSQFLCRQRAQGSHESYYPMDLKMAFNDVTYYTEREQIVSATLDTLFRTWGHCNRYVRWRKFELSQEVNSRAIACCLSLETSQMMVSLTVLPLPVQYAN